MSFLRDVGGLKDYLISKSDIFFYYEFPTSFSGGEYIIEKYKDKKIIFKKKININIKNFTINRFLNLLFFNLIIIFFNIKNYKIINYHPLLFTDFFFINKFYKNKYIFWILDFFPQEGSIYNFILKKALLRSNSLIYLSEKLSQIYQKNFPNLISSKLNFIKDFAVPNTPISLKRKLSHNDNINILFSGILRENLGLDLLSKILRKNKDIFLNIAGHCPDQNILKYFKGVSNFKFHGSFLDINELQTIARNSHIAIGMYKISDDHYSNYTDNSKLKMYCDLELPIITTSNNSFTNNLIKSKSGKVINYDEVELLKAIYEIREDYSLFYNNIINLKKTYLSNKHYNDLYDKL